MAFYIPLCFGASRAFLPLLRCLGATAFLKGPGFVMVGAFLFYLITGYSLARLRLVLVGPGGFLNALLRPLSAGSLASY